MGGWRRPRLRTLLLLSNLLVLVLPVSGLWALRLYESALVRQTEAELRAQAAVLAGTWRATRGLAGEDLSQGLTPLALETARRRGLDLATDPVLPVPPNPHPGSPATPETVSAGARLRPVLRDAQAVTLAAIRLLDGQGTIVSSTGNDTGLSLAGLAEVDAARAGHPASVLRQREKIADDLMKGVSRTAGLRVHVALPVLAPADGGGERVDAVVLLSRTPANLRDAVSGKLRPIAALCVLLLLLVAALAVLASRLITRPLRIVAEVAGRVAAGETARLPPVPTVAVREAAELSDAIARMTHTLEGRSTYIRGLAAHVSHEFKTPLAAISGAAELLADHDNTMTPAERARFVSSIGEEASRLHRLVRGLLDLARADMSAAGPGARAALHELAAEAAARVPALRVSVSGEAEAAAAPGAVSTVFDALFGNVLAHAGPGRAVAVRIAREGGRAVVTVADDGPGLSPGNAARAFDPFFTTSRSRGGTGLGLPIARSLLDGAGGTITLVPSEAGVEAGATFRVVLPLAPPIASERGDGQ